MISPEGQIVGATRPHLRGGALSRRATDRRAARQFRRLAGSVMQEFPPTTGGSLLFSGVSSSCHTAEVAHVVAKRLAELPEMEVLLVDVDSRDGVLSEQLGRAQQAGFTDVLQGRSSLSAALVATGLPNLRFLSFGDRRYGQGIIEPVLIKSTLAMLRQVCRYAIFVGGMELSPLQAMLGRHCDGTYLVVQLGDASRQDTSDLAGYFSRAGARLIGCVATDVA